MPDSTFLAWPFFDDAHRALGGDAAAWVAANVRHTDEAGDIEAQSRALVRALGDAGWLRYAVPAAYGGMHEALDVRSLCILRETLGYQDGLADFAFAMQGLGSAPISLFGSDDLKDRYLPGVGAGDRIAAFALSEPDAGSDVAAMKTSATEDGDGYVLNGEKTWISNGGIADQYVVFARTGEAPGARGLSAFVVDADAAGLEIAERIDVIAPHPLARLKFTDCRVPGGQRLGAPGEGFKVAMATLDIFRSTVAAAALGFARRALDEALDRTEAREAFGEKLADMQLVQAKLGEMALNVDAAALLIYRAAWTKDVLGQRVSREASMAKYFATETAQQVIDSAVQLFGGLGVVSGATVERLYREIRALRIYEGTSEIQLQVIAGQARAARAGKAATGKKAAE